MSADGVPLGAVFAYGGVEGRICVQHGLEGDMSQHEEEAGTEHRSDKATSVTWKTKKETEVGDHVLKMPHFSWTKDQNTKFVRSP